MAGQSALRTAVAAAALLALAACGASAFVGSQPAQGADRLTAAAERVVATQGRAAASAAPEEDPLQVASTALRAALAIMAALAVAFVPMDGAEAARSGGRMGGGMGRGGGGFGGRAPPPRAQTQRRAAPSSGPNINIGVGPVFAPPMFSPFGFGMPFFGPPIIPIPFGSSGPSNTDRMIQDQQRRDESVIDQQKQQIDQMQRELSELKAKKQ